MSGHSKWSTIKRKKGAIDAARSRLWTKIIKEVSIAARDGGGDPGGNPRLRRAIDLAKANNVPSDNIDRAIKKGTGELEGVSYEELVYEGVGPDGVLFILDIVTDNRNRTAAEIRKIFDKHGGQLGQSGSAAWAFDVKGIVRLSAEDATEEQLFEVAVGAGAEDLTRVSDQWMITTPRDDLEAVRSALEDAGITVAEAQLEKIAKTPKTIGGASADKLMALTEALEEHDDVQNVFSDFELSDEALAQLESRA